MRPVSLSTVLAWLQSLVAQDGVLLEKEEDGKVSVYSCMQNTPEPLGRGDDLEQACLDAYRRAHPEPADAALTPYEGEEGA